MKHQFMRGLTALVAVSLVALPINAAVDPTARGIAARNTAQINVAQIAADAARFTYLVKNDGTNTTTAIQSYLDACASGTLGSNALRLAAGAYGIQDPGLVIKGNCELTMDSGAYFTVLSDMTNPVITGGNSSGAPFSGRLRNITIEANFKSAGPVWMQRFKNIWLEDIIIHNPKPWLANSYYLKVGNTGGLSAYGLNLLNYRGELTSTPPTTGYDSTSSDLWMLAGVTDSNVLYATPLDAAVGVKIEGNGGNINLSFVHPWNHNEFGGTMLACFDDSTNFTNYLNDYADGCLSQGYQMRGYNSVFVNSGYFLGAYGGTDNVSIGFNFTQPGASPTLINSFANGYSSSVRLAKDFSINTTSGATILNTYSSNVVTKLPSQITGYDAAQSARYSLTYNQRLANTSATYYDSFNGDYWLQANNGQTVYSAHNGKLTLNSDSYLLPTSKTPASATATCTTGEMAADSSYFYRCVSTNSWKRAAIAAW